MKIPQLPSLDRTAIKGLFGAFPTGVVAVAAMSDEQAEIMLVSSFAVGISLDPPLATFAAQRYSTTWPRISAASRIGISILGETHDSVAMQIASADRGARLRGVGIDVSEAGAVFLQDSAARYECSVECLSAAGDHDLVTLRIWTGRQHPEILPLLVHHAKFVHLGHAEGARGRDLHRY
jgi:flavin reductase (DIM6/NTAB) family NADH-FMN oxidoreductase RutF